MISLVISRIIGYGISLLNIIQDHKWLSAMIEVSPRRVNGVLK
ncbi:Uncharacterised protein [Yersinia similis]|uniref:Uncharacterized protein n=1 Tax=Yersinia similis TaxID=367190 RepID=A0A0T9NN02_9GAMM|nr:Uncharacterised protein [Yersinia similis]CNC55929.1 Uncharacterised protein [Yersinia similis]CNF25637.1 Uncharacterised protein [Yersinia similis]CNG65895.1 Uncharacterised protein [Yersinia similis]CNH21207.1 Uncharacterised protein [Yersinia similis]